MVEFGFKQEILLEQCQQEAQFTLADVSGILKGKEPSNYNLKEAVGRLAQCVARMSELHILMVKVGKQTK